MPLVVKRSWGVEGGEIAVLRHLEKIFRNEPHEVLLFNNVHLGTFKVDEKQYHGIMPDYIIVDPKRGIAVVEVKDWVEFSINGNFAKLKSGEFKLNPLVTAQKYFFNLSAILKKKGGKLESGHVSSHLVFTKYPSHPELNAEHIHVHFEETFKKITLESLFPQAQELPVELLECIHMILCPAEMFYKQVNKVKCELTELDRKQVEIVSRNPIGHYLVTGIPGSGKSLLISSRAIFLRNQFPDWKILVLSVNRRLNDKIETDIKQRLREFEGRAGFIKCDTLKGFLEKITPRTAGMPKKYIEMMDHLREKCQPTEEWDAILVDEYQDFTDRDFAIILKSCVKHWGIINNEERLTENLFLCGDSLQQIWDGGCSHSWDSMDIHIKGKGRSEILKASYRSPSSIVKLGLKYLNLSGLKDEVKRFYEGTDDVQHLNRGEHHIKTEIGWDQNASELHFNVRHVLNSGVDPADILIITFPGQGEQILDEAFKKEIAQGLTVSTQNQVKGLEFRHVFIYNLGRFDYKMAATPKLLARVIYMCLTRSNYFLHVSAFKAEGSILLLQEIYKEIEEEEKAA